MVSQLKSPLLSLLICSQIYFILHGSGSFESNPEGIKEYQKFFKDRVSEIQALGPISSARLFGYLDEEVFGVQQKVATAEQKRQEEFSKTQLEVIKTQAAMEGIDEEAEDEQGRDDQQDESIQPGTSNQDRSKD